MSELSKFNLESLPDWARDALDEALKPPPAKSALAHLDGVAWPLLVQAAVVRSFLPRDLAPDEVKEEKRSEAEKIVLRFAETTYGPEGVQWSLTHQSRTEVLETALARGDLKHAIDATAMRFDDDVSLALRTCLTKTPNWIAAADLRSLEATRIAVASLSGISAVKLPSLEDLDREIELHRLLAQFERMVGRQSGETGEKTDRFFGRDEELERLRSYVGVIPADSVLGSAKRALDWVSRKVKGRAPMAVWGVGGVGKTTLISKFMLEHAEAAASRYPFAYLDFDRSMIGARQRLGLVAEMCLQTGAQFKELAEPMANLYAEIRELARKLESTHEFESMSFVGLYTLKFRQLVDQHLDALESRFEWSRPFLLVFDTFEVVQYGDDEVEGQDDITGLEEFVQGFSQSDDSGLWPRLRLIISGRKKVSRFLGKVEDLPIGALDRKGSAALLMALAGDANKPIAEPEARKLVAAVAKATGERNRGVQPLRLRLIGEVFRRVSEDGPTIVRSLVEELSEPLKSHGLGAQVLIDGILIRRVLEHVADVRVKALADPGLVLRRITPGVIKDVMTRGTSKPGASESMDPDAESVEPWIIDDSEAQAIFNSFRKEVSLVELDGDALRHRPDVRQQMLPLIRARRPKRFKALNRLAFDYFYPRAKTDVQDLKSAEEAVYHGLWLEEPLSQLNKLWRVSPTFRPRIDPSDFDRGSLANIYVNAKARAPLASHDVSQLPREVALEWLDARSTDLLEDRRVEEAIEAIRTAAGDNYQALANRVGTAAVLARLLYRCGLWDEAVRLALHHIDLAGEDELAGPEKSEKKKRGEKTLSRAAGLLSLVRIWATVVGKSGAPAPVLNRLSQIAHSVRDPLARIEIAAHAVAAGALLGTEWRAEREGLKQQVIWPAMLDVERSRWRREQKILRLMIVTEDHPTAELLATWVEASERVPRDVEPSVIGNLFTQIFVGGRLATESEEMLQGLDSSRRRGTLNRLDELWRAEKPSILEAVRNREDLQPGLRALVAADNSDWARPLGNALTRALKDKDGEALTEMLEEGAFRIRRSRKWREQYVDGVALVQSALDDGRLLQLATTLEQWRDTSAGRKGSPDEHSGYPQDVFGISRALVSWSYRSSLPPEGLLPPAP